MNKQQWAAIRQAHDRWSAACGDLTLAEPVLRTVVVYSTEARIARDEYEEGLLTADDLIRRIVEVVNADRASFDVEAVEAALNRLHHQFVDAFNRDPLLRTWLGAPVATDYFDLMRRVLDKFDEAWGLFVR